MAQAILARSLTKNGLPTGRNLDDDRPQRILSLVLAKDQDHRLNSLLILARLLFRNAEEKPAPEQVERWNRGAATVHCGRWLPGAVVESFPFADNTFRLLPAGRPGRAVTFASTATSP